MNASEVVLAYGVDMHSTQMREGCTVSDLSGFIAKREVRGSAFRRRTKNTEEELAALCKVQTVTWSTP